MTAGLLDADLRFHHPLVRSAVYHAATAEQRRRVHLALAEVTDPEVDPDHRAWHLAEAVTGLDESVAEELERSAGRAQRRGGRAAAAGLLERAAELTPEPQRRSLRLLMAAHAQLMAGATDRAQALLDQSLPNLGDAPLRAHAMRIQGIIRFADGRGGETPSLLFQAAMGLKDTDELLAREVLMEAFEAAMWAGRLTSGTTPLAVAEAAREVPAPDGDTHVGSLLLTAYTVRLTDGYASAVEGWRRAVAAYTDEFREQPQLKWDALVWIAAGELLDFETHYATGRERARGAREQGALATLPGALSALAWCEVLAGRIEAAEALVAEAEEITRATGAPAVPGASEILQAGNPLLARRRGQGKADCRQRGGRGGRARPGTRSDSRRVRAHDPRARPGALRRGARARLAGLRRGRAGVRHVGSRRRGRGDTAQRRRGGRAGRAGSTARARPGERHAMGARAARACRGAAGRR